MGYPCLDLHSHGGLRTAGGTPGDRGTGLYLCFAALWGGEKVPAGLIKGG